MDMTIATESFGRLLRESFLFPGQQIATFLGTDSMDIPLRDAIEHATGFDPLPLLMSVVVWLLVALGLLGIVRRLLGFARRVGDYFDGLLLRLKLGLIRASRSAKNILTLGRFAGKDESVSSTAIDLDDTDIEVLKIARARCPGLAISAPDLAEHLHSRPMVIQDRLQRLARYQLLENIIGSTDGYDNFTLTPAGGAFVRKLP